jgi:hypothetical protein
MSGFGPRFLFEVAFLVLLALAAGLAELEWPWIVVLMAVGWVLVVLVEWLAWRSETASDQAAAATATGEDGEFAPEEATSWDIQDILAPVSDEDAEGGTRVVPPAERPDDAEGAA